MPGSRSLVILGEDIAALLGLARMREFLQRRNEIEHLYRLLTLQLGTSLMVSVKARMKGESAAQLVAGINR